MTIQEFLTSVGLIMTFLLSAFALWKSMKTAPNEMRMLDVDLSKKYNDLANEAFERAKELETSQQAITQLKLKAETRAAELESLLKAQETYTKELEDGIRRHEQEILALKERVKSQEEELALLRKKIIYQDVEIIKLKEIVSSDEAK